jgi:hypothetical protein
MVACDSRKNFVVRLVASLITERGCPVTFMGFCMGEKTLDPDYIVAIQKVFFLSEYPLQSGVSPAEWSTPCKVEKHLILFGSSLEFLR